MGIEAIENSMTRKDTEEAYLRPIFQGTVNTNNPEMNPEMNPGTNPEIPGQTPQRYPLSSRAEVILGREPSCEILVSSQQYVMVSRRHAVIQPAGNLPNGQSIWSICDLNSANGTYVNDRRLKDCQKLTAGDRISLGKNGPKFMFEYIDNRQTTAMNYRQTPPGVNSVSSPPSPKNYITFTQLFPIVSTGRDLTRKAYLIPGSITVLFVVLMFATLGNANLFNLFVIRGLFGGCGLLLPVPTLWETETLVVVTRLCDRHHTRVIKSLVITVYSRFPRNLTRFTS